MNALYREIPLKDTTSLRLRKYCNAAANLYGVIPLRKLYEIITAQNKSLVTEEEFLAFARIARHECKGYYILSQADLYVDGPEEELMDYEIIALPLLDEDLDGYQDLLRGHGDKPYYVPDRKTFLAYDDPFYWEPTSQFDAFRNVLLIRTTLKPERLDQMLEDLCWKIRWMFGGPQDVLECLEENGGQLKGPSDLQPLLDAYQDLCNHTRMPYNRGYTPAEMIAMAPPENRGPKTITLGSHPTPASGRGSGTA